MTARRERGHMSKAVEELCIRLCLMNGSEAEFREGIKKLLQDYSYLGNVLFHDIATSLRRYIVEYCKDDEERIRGIWQLADEADVRITKAWEDFSRVFLEEK